ncbi:MAG: hypothetical protein P4L83_06875 [Nevskia sp.]|nr:hypothetical protein [Nevskia sp.]
MPRISRWGPGRWFSTLRYYAWRDVAEWRASNSTIRELRYNPIHTLLILGSQNLVAAQIVLIAVGGLASGIICWVQPSIPAKWAFWSVQGDMAAMLTTVWTVQVTLAAVVYPIVIGFITLLFQQRPASSLRMMIFLNDSGAKLSGLSSLILCLVAAVQWFFCKAVGEEVLCGWVLFDTVWLALNTAASVFFLYRTFEVLQSKKAEHIVQRYAVDVMFQQEVRRALPSLILLSASNIKLLPKPKLDDHLALVRGEPSILVSPMMSQSGEPCVFVPSTRPLKVREVSLRLLGWAIGRWLARAESADRPPAGRHRGPGLYFPAFPDQCYTDGIDLCRVDGPVLPTPFERRVIRWSYRLGRYRDHAAEPLITELMEELSQDVLENIEKRQLIRARGRLKVMRELHTAILNAGEFLVGGQKDNYALLSTLSLASVSVHDNWARQYFTIFEASAAAVSDDHGFFEAVAYLPSNLFADTQTLRNAAIGDRIISLGRISMLKLGRWWTGEIEKLGRGPSGPCAAAILDPRNRRNYGEALRAFTGAWEQMARYYFDYGARRKRAPWDDQKLTAHFQLTHLDETVLIFFDGMARGDQQCAEAIADILKQWKPSIDLSARVDRFLVRTPYLMTMALLEGDEVALQADIELPDHVQMKRDLAETVMAVVFDNLWTDCMLVAAYCLAHWGKDCPCETSLAAQFIPHFLQKRLESPYGASGILGQIEVQVAFWAMLRQHFSDAGYRAQINALVEKIQGIRAAPMVMGRIYTHWGTSDLDSLLDAQLIVLCLLIRADWRAELGREREILKLLRWELNRGEHMDQWLGQLLGRLQDPSIKSWEAFFRCAAKPISQSLTFDHAVAAVTQTLTSFREAVKKAHVTEIQQAPIDPAELDRVASWASEKGFAKATGAMPVSLFTDIRYMPEDLPERHVTFNRMDRGEFTTPRRSTRPSGEDHVVTDSVREYVGAFVLNAAVVQAKPLTETRDVPTHDVYWRELQAAAASLTAKGLTPVLLIENPMTPSWIYDWGSNWSQDRLERPKDLRVVRKDDVEIPEYLGHFNDIAVYQAHGLPEGASFLFAREAFHKLEFTEFGNKQLAKVDWSPTSNAPTLIDLKVTWGQRVNLGQYPVTRLQYWQRNTQ